MAESWLNHEPIAVSDGNRFQVVVHVNEDALKGTTHVCGEIEGGPLIVLERFLAPSSGSDVLSTIERNRIAPKMGCQSTRLFRAEI